MQNKTIWLLYEVAQVEKLVSYWKDNPEEKNTSSVIALSLDIESKLKEMNIVFFSARTYKQTFNDMLAKEDEIISNFFSDLRWKKFAYKGVDLKMILLFKFRIYLQRARYYSNLIISIIENHSKIEGFALFSPHEIPKSEATSVFIERQRRVVVDCVEILAREKGMSVKIIPIPLLHRNASSRMRTFIHGVVRPKTFDLVLTIWNTINFLFHRSSHPRLLISDYWKNIGESINLLKESECIFLDRKEIRNISWNELFQHRMRFFRIEDFLTYRMRMHAREGLQEIDELWKSMRNEIGTVFVWRGQKLDSLLLLAMDGLVADCENILFQIEATFELYKKLQPDVVMLRASVSGQPHFSVLSLVAKLCDISVVELQHGLEYLGPGSISREHASEYIAVYGSLVKKEFVSIGYSPEKIKEIGSPRFDAYGSNVIPRNEHISKKITVLCIVPDIRTFEIHDSYSVEDYLQMIAKGVKSFTNLHIIIKLRPGPTDEALFRTIIKNEFSEVSYTIAQYEPVSDLLSRADIVVSYFSTVNLEALQYGIPIIIPVLNPVDESVVRLHFSQYEKEKVLFIAPSASEITTILRNLIINPNIRESIKIQSRIFLEKHFSFDGKSSERYATLINELSKLP